MSTPRTWAHRSKSRHVAAVRLCATAWPGLAANNPFPFWPGPVGNNLCFLASCNSSLQRPGGGPENTARSESVQREQATACAACVEALPGGFCACVVCLHLALAEAGALLPVALLVAAGLAGLVALAFPDAALDRLLCEAVQPLTAKRQASRPSMRCMRIGLSSSWAFSACSMF